MNTKTPGQSDHPGTSLLTKRTILVAVDDLIRRIGWAGTTVGKVAEAAGVSRQSVYNAFGSRQSLSQAYALYRLDLMLEAADRVLRSAEDLEAGLHEAMSLFFDMVDEPLIHTILSGSRPEELVPLVKVLNERATDQLAGVLQDIRPEITDSDAVIFADTICRLIVGHALAPTLEREVAISRMVRVSVLVLDSVGDQPAG